MRQFKADLVYTLSGSPIENGLVITQDDGTIVQVKPYEGEDNVEVLGGVICPGFVNTHCHLELSYLKDKLSEKKGLHEFIKEIEQLKQPSDALIEQSIAAADERMFQNGIVAVADICNTSNSFATKLASSLYYHHLVEVYAFHPDRAEAAFEKGKALFTSLQEQKQAVSIVPHAPYSVSDKLWNLIIQHAKQNKSILSIHNQENPDENLLFTSNRGKILERLQSFGIDTSFWNAKGKNSLAYILQFIDAQQKLLLVHNTYTTQADMEQALATHSNLFWCFCPNANLYIENKLPDFGIFKTHIDRLTIGTDSLASNYDLCVWSELKAIAKNSSVFSLQELLRMACINGARYLGIEQQFGSIEKNKKPGLVLIKNNLGNTISQQSAVQRLI